MNNTKIYVQERVPLFYIYIVPFLLCACDGVAFLGSAAQLSVQRIRILPISWQQKVLIIQSMMSKLTLGQGMHKLCVGKEAARAMRATVIRTLFDQDHYDCAPTAAVLAESTLQLWLF